MIILKSAAELARMRPACRMAARILNALVRKVGPGVTTAELDDFAAGMIGRLGGRSAFYHYRGYPGYVCISINDEVVHGVPGPRAVGLGDIVSIDVGVFYDGYVGDTAATAMVGVTDPDVIRLVETTRRALDAGIAAAQPGRRVSDISHAIESAAAAEGFSAVRAFVGHGVGRSMHEDPQVPNFGAPGHGAKLKPGMTLALEPMLNMGESDVEVLADGWTVRTRDRRPSAHFEHTIAIREDGVEVLTEDESDVNL